jgi:hypothetical protein
MNFPGLIVFYEEQFLAHLSLFFYKCCLANNGNVRDSCGDAGRSDGCPNEGGGDYCGPRSPSGGATFRNNAKHDMEFRKQRA